MGKGDLAGMRRRTSPDKPRCRSAMMRAAERPPSCKNCRNIFAHHRMDKRRFQTLFLAKAGQDAAKPLRKHCFARTGRSHHDYPVPARCRNLQCALCHLMPQNLRVIA